MRDIHSFEPFWNEWYLVRPLGQGSYGTVYLAEKESFGEKYYSAIKHIPIPPRQSQADELLAEGMISSPEEARGYYVQMVNDLMSEINVNYRLKGHTNIVSYEEHQIIERTDSPGFDLFIKMELLTSLTDYMRNHPFTVSDVIRLGIDICKALSVLQREHIVHRDIKPANIFVNDGGDYKLGDFGVARIMDKTVSSMSVKGTFAYMAPEVARGLDGSYSVDIYPLGLVMHKMLNYNRAPFLPLPPAMVSYADNQEAQRKRLQGTPIPLPALGPELLGRIIQQCCAYRPEDRWANPGAMQYALEQLQQELPAQALAQVVCDTSHLPGGYTMGNSTIRHLLTEESQPTDQTGGTSGLQTPPPKNPIPPGVEKILPVQKRAKVSWRAGSLSARWRRQRHLFSVGIRRRQGAACHCSTLPLAHFHNGGGQYCRAHADADAHADANTAPHTDADAYAHTNGAGTTIITATCGGYGASCAVSVS